MKKERRPRAIYVTTGLIRDANRNMKHIIHQERVLTCISSTNLLGDNLFHIQNKTVAKTKIISMIAITH